MPSPLDRTRKRDERRVFLFLTVVLAPLLTVVVIGVYGLGVWLYQSLTRPPF